MYIALGPTGCTLDGNVFHSFTYTASATGGAATITADQILVTPAFLAPETAQFTFTAPWGAGSGQTQTSAIRYTAALASIDTKHGQLNLLLGGHKVGSHGRATVAESSGGQGGLLVYKQCGGSGCQSKLEDSLLFSPVKMMVIREQVSVTNATLSGFTASVNRCYLCP
jgi:hypothetical protein